MTEDPNKEILYNPLGEEDFDKDKFLQGYSEVQGLEKILKTLKEDALNPQAIQLAGKILHGNDNFYYSSGEQNTARISVEQSLSEGQKGLEKYLSKNESKMLDHLSKEDYINLVQAVKLEKKDGDENHNKLVSAQDEFNKFKDAIQDEQKTLKYLSEKIKKAPKWAQAEFSRLNSNQRYAQLMMQSYGGFFQNKYAMALENADHERVFKDSLNNTKKKGDYYKVISQEVANKLAA